MRRFSLLMFNISILSAMALYSNCAPPAHYVEAIAQSTENPIPLPEPPSLLVAVAVSSQQIDLSWMDNSTDEIGFIIQRSMGNAGVFTEIYRTKENTISYQDSGLAANTPYSYRVATYTAGGASSFTTVSTVSTFSDALTPPLSPHNLVATGTSGAEINLEWIDNSSDELGFKIERSGSEVGPFVEVAVANANQTKFVDLDRPPLSTFYYKVSAFNRAGSSAYSNVASATTLAPLPQAPSQLNLQVLAADSIELTWFDNSTDESGFKIERAVSNLGPFVEVGIVGPNATTFYDSGLSPVTAYFYRVYSYSPSGKSSPTSLLSEVTFGTYSWFFNKINLPKCYDCHTAGAGSKKYRMGNYLEIKTKILPGNPVDSKLYTECESGVMPPKSTSLTANQLYGLRTWISNGAIEN